MDNKGWDKVPHSRLQLYKRGTPETKLPSSSPRVIFHRLLCQYSVSSLGNDSSGSVIISQERLNNNYRFLGNKRGILHEQCMRLVKIEDVSFIHNSLVIQFDFLSSGKALVQFVMIILKLFPIYIRVHDIKAHVCPNNSVWLRGRAVPNSHTGRTYERHRDVVSHASKHTHSQTNFICIYANNSLFQETR